MKERYFVTGIGTDVGKTIVSAIVLEALKADYWKPVQAGTQPLTDTQRVQELVSNGESAFLAEGIVLQDPMSPHAAAENEGIHFELSELKLPETSNHLVIEGAGGLMVPLNDSELVIDIASHFGADAILVSRNYLGSINHTLLSFEVMKQRGITIAGIVFNGKPNMQTETYIMNYTGLPCLLRINEEEEFDLKTIRKYAKLWNQE